MSQLATNFNPPPLMDPETYRATLEALLANGAGLGKTKNVGAFLLPDIEVVTETSAGEVETSRTIDVKLGKEKAYILLDMDQYPLPQQRELVMLDMAKQWGKKVIHESDLPALSRPGIWVNKQSAVEFDYRPVDASDLRNSVREPNPEAYRVCLSVGTPVNIPVQWDGGFVVQSGGTLAIRERDVAALAEALQSIRAGAGVEEALFSKPGVAKFDVYGMEPGFAETQYGAVSLKSETQGFMASFASPSVTPLALDNDKA